MKPSRLMTSGRAQRGAATIVVVMVLFLVMALLAAYASRSLVFEQRISGSYYRSSMAQEMSEGGVDWTVAMLNGPAIGADCKPVANGGQRFIDRYMTISPVDRIMKATGTTDPEQPAVDCQRTDQGLVCRCPARDTRTTQPSVTNADMLVPSLAVTLGFRNIESHYGNFILQSRGCTSSSVDDCLAGTASRSQRANAAAMQNAWVAFVGAVPSVPSSPLTVAGTLSTTGAGGLGLHNSDSRSNGTLVVSGGNAPTLNEDRMDSLPGTPASTARIFNDATLQAIVDQAGRDKLFQTYLGMKPARYKNHPALQEVDCTTGDCGQKLEEAYNAGKRILWVKPSLAINSNRILGSAADPVLIISEGGIALAGPMQITGMVVAQGDMTWDNTGGLTSMITGSVLVTKGMVATGRMDIQYLQSVADQLRNRLGSFARVPGGMMDATDVL